MLNQLIQIDQELLLALNGSGVPFWDVFFSMVTKTFPWLFMALGLVILLYKNTNWKYATFFILMFAMVVLCADQFASSFCKPFFHRFRPSHEPALEGLVTLVNGRAGGLYGFISSHAANTFGVAAFVGTVLRKKQLTITLLCWAILSSYSRIYLGLHYPSDILAGALCGAFIGFGLGLLTTLVLQKYSSFFSPERVRFSALQVNIVSAIFFITVLILLILALCKM